MQVREVATNSGCLPERLELRLNLKATKQGFPRNTSYQDERSSSRGWLSNILKYPPGAIPN
jgi:hypothetical protein